jgi:hypothetical protein
MSSKAALQMNTIYHNILTQNMLHHCVPMRVLRELHAVIVDVPVWEMAAAFPASDNSRSGGTEYASDIQRRQ